MLAIVSNKQRSVQIYYHIITIHVRRKPAEYLTYISKTVQTVLLSEILFILSHFTSLENGIPPKLPNVNIACDWLSWQNPTPHCGIIYSAVFDWLEIGLTRIKPNAKQNAQFFYPFGKREQLRIPRVKPVTIKNVPYVSSGTINLCLPLPPDVCTT